MKRNKEKNNAYAKEYYQKHNLTDSTSNKGSRMQEIAMLWGS